MTYEQFFRSRLGFQSVLCIFSITLGKLITYSLCNMRVKDWIKISIGEIIFLLKVL